MIRLTKHQILQMHADLIDLAHESSGIRDNGLFELAIAAPFMEFAGTAVYPTLEEKAAALGCHLIKNHAMIDGNKRIGAHAMLVFLALNDIRLSYTQKELIDIIMGVAAGKESQDDLLQWIRSHQT